MYVAMSGAKETLRAQAANNHNLANASTTGFRADLAAFMSRPIEGPGFDTRAYATTSTLGWSHDNGAIIATKGELDVAVKGAGWIAVQDSSGKEAYTRAGDLHLEVDGTVKNAAGHAVVGDSGPLVVPPHASLTVGTDGSLSIVPLGQGPETVATVGRIKLVNPDATQLQRGDDGLFRLKDGTDAPPDTSVTLATGALESSNVNTAAAMVNMIELSRNFDMQLKAMHAADDNAKNATSLLKLA